MKKLILVLFLTLGLSLDFNSFDLRHKKDDLNQMDRQELIEMVKNLEDQKILLEQETNYLKKENPQYQKTEEERKLAYLTQIREDVKLYDRDNTQLDLELDELLKNKKENLKLINDLKRVESDLNKKIFGSKFYHNRYGQKKSLQIFKRVYS